jgi:TPR repeat protein
MDQRLVLKTIGTAVAAGLVVGTSPAILRSIEGFMRGPSSGQSAATELNAEAAATSLQKPLTVEQQQELMRGLLFIVRDQPAAAVGILGKYAMLGEPAAQMQIGGMYYFGKGLPRDHEEGIRWLRLAAAQGISGGQETLSAALNGTWEWGSPGNTTFASPLSGAEPYAQHYGDDPASIGLGSNTAPIPVPGAEPTAVTLPHGTNGADSFHSRVQQELYADSGARGISSAINDTSPPQNNGAINIRSGQYMAPAGPNGYVDPRSGTFYAPSGPDGVSNTRTGEYSQISH